MKGTRVTVRTVLASLAEGASIPDPENSMLGAAHSAAKPLTARFGVVHGEAVGMLLPHVVRFNAHHPASHLRYFAPLTIRSPTVNIGT